nr:regulatory iron-sulfur-containing complex subunit RicT [Candidatus Gracilibacteria bacterium]
KYLALQEQAQVAKPKVLQAVKDLNLEMSVVEVKIDWLEKQILVVFVAETRIDFRQLVTILANIFKKKIRLYQIGNRDRAQFCAGYGVCGRELCCSGFFQEMPAVTMDAAREQNISFKGGENLSGVCGKLKCCLNYELDQYRKLKKLFPKYGSTVKIEDKEHKVIGIDVLNKKIKLRSGHSYQTMDLEEFNTYRNIPQSKNKNEDLLESKISVDE